jgi:hypothetical protein
MKQTLSQFSLRGSALFVGAAVCCAVLMSASAARAQIEVLEVMYNATDDNVWEWIEVRNTGASAVDLNGYLGFNLGDADVTDPNPTLNSTLDPDTTVNPGEIAVIYDGFYGTGNANNYVDQRFRDAWGLGAGVKLIGADFFPALTNTVGAQGQSVGFWASDADWKLDQTPVEDDPINNPGVFTNRTTSFTNAAFSLDFSGASFPTVDGVSSITWTGSGSNQTGTNWYQSVSGSNGAVTSVQVQVPGTLNGPTDVGNPGIVAAGTPSVAGLYFTEIMYDASGAEPAWEWVEVYNATTSAVDLTGYVLDDNNGTAVSAANIAAGAIPAGGTAILYNADLDQTSFAAAWGAGLNLVPVAEWGDLALNNTGDVVGLWDSFGDYTGDHANHTNTVANQSFLEADGFPSATQGQSVYWNDLGADPTVADNWDGSIVGDGIGSFAATVLSGNVTLHPGGDVGSPGTFVPGTVGTPGDFDNDGDVDGRDFLAWQRGESPTPLSASDLADWQANYGVGGLAAVGAVPEPTSLALLALALVPVACGRKR